MLPNDIKHEFDNLSERINQLKDNPQLQDEKELEIVGQKLNALEARTEREYADALSGDMWIYRIVVFALAEVAVVSISGVLLIANSSSKDAVPDAALALGSAAVGALAGLLAPSPRG